jgi:chitodextrinase
MILTSALFLLTRVHHIDPPSVAEVRIAYIIPSDRKPPSGYNRRIDNLVGWIRGFYAYEMERHGFGRKTFNLEADPKSGQPVIHLLKSKMTAAEFVGKGDVGYVGGPYVENSQKALRDAGLPAEHTVWLAFVEAQYQDKDGSIKNDTAEGSGVYGAGNALCSGLPIALADPAIMSDYGVYDGRTISALGPYPLKYLTSFPWYQGQDVNSLAAVFVSAAAHELGHAFLLEHSYLNDDNFDGNLMGNGFRGWRGYMVPKDFPAEGLRLSRSSALILNLSPFFRPGPANLSPAPPPDVTVETSTGKMTLEKGVFNFNFRVDDSNGPGLALAVLENGTGRNGVGVVAWKQFPNGVKVADTTLTTTNFELGVEDTWRLSVFDRAGNFSEQTIKLSAPPSGAGPAPFISVAHTDAAVNQAVAFQAREIRQASFTGHWKFGDGDEADGPTPTHIYRKPGLYEVTLIETDQAGYTGSVTQYIRVR